MIRRSRVTTRPGLKTRTRAVADREKAYGSVAEKLKSIAKLDAKEQEIARQRAVLLEEIEHDMKAAALDKVDDGVYQATYQGTMGKSTRTIDPEKFSEAVDAEVFWGCISVSVTAAAKHLTEKEIDAIATTVPGTMSAPKLSVKLLKKGK